MRRAIDETDRRRNKQLAYNLAHGITPIGISKRIKDIIDGVYDQDAARQDLKAAQSEARYDAMGGKDLTRELKRVEKEMFDCAKNLEFERAAELRDQLKILRERLFIAAA
jgi:excinuclease ABC subunit B